MKKQFLLGYDIGSSSIKGSLLDVETGRLVSTAFSPGTEMRIDAPNLGWAEQNPGEWWDHLVIVTNKIIDSLGDKNFIIGGIGISYQMHGLVLIDRNYEVLHPSIIWCDSRAVDIGESAFKELGAAYCLGNCLNSPGNFTASKLKWVKEFRPTIYEKVYKFMLPGDYIALKLTGEVNTTISGLSEGIFWDFKKNGISSEILELYGFERDLIPEIVPTFGDQGKLSSRAAAELGLKEGIPVTYRAGDQPNNAFSLKVLNPGEIASTAGTSGVVYGITDLNAFDPLSRVNSFAHVNYTPDNPLKGVLLCVNGTGILYNWLRNELMKTSESYDSLNKIAATVPVGSDGLFVFPFGNGAERILANKNPGCSFHGINFNNHTRAHMIRASQEGIAYAFNYGVEIMKEMGMEINLMRAGRANMFLSDIFSEAVANTCNTSVEFYKTDGSQGAARGAGVGSGIYRTFEESFENLEKIGGIEPTADLRELYSSKYQNWKETLNSLMDS